MLSNSSHSNHKHADEKTAINKMKMLFIHRQAGQGGTEQ